MVAVRTLRYRAVLARLAHLVARAMSVPPACPARTINVRLVGRLVAAILGGGDEADNHIVCSDDICWRHLGRARPVKAPDF